jgi:DNA-binding MarR family transcriptional regulator
MPRSKYPKKYLVTVGAQRRTPPSALLRKTCEMIRVRLFKELMDGGYDDLNQALLDVLTCPYLNGMHPSDLARWLNMSKQAINHLLGRLETLGYVERHPEKRRSSTLVFLTSRGKEAFKLAQKAAKRVEAEWKAMLGPQQFDVFIDMLSKLAAPLSGPKSAAPARQLAPANRSWRS